MNCFAELELGKKQRDCSRRFSLKVKKFQLRTHRVCFFIAAHAQELHVPMERVPSLAAPVPPLILLHRHHVRLLRIGQV